MVPDTLGHPVLIIAFVHCTIIRCIINLICCYLIMVTFCNYIESHLLQYYRLQKCLQFFFSCIYSTFGDKIQRTQTQNGSICMPSECSSLKWINELTFRNQCMLIAISTSLCEHPHSLTFKLCRFISRARIC